MGFSKSNQSSQNQSQQTGNSYNQAYPGLNATFAPATGNTAVGTNAIRALLGLDGGTAQDEGFQKFKDSSGYDFIRNEGIRGIDASNASKGLLNSGSALKGISSYSSGLAQNFLNSYLAQLQGLSNTGIQSGQILANAGQTSTSQGTSSGNSTGKSSQFSFG